MKIDQILKNQSISNQPITWKDLNVCTWGPHKAAWPPLACTNHNDNKEFVH